MDSQLKQVDSVMPMKQFAGKQTMMVLTMRQVQKHAAVLGRIFNDKYLISRKKAQVCNMKGAWLNSNHDQRVHLLEGSSTNLCYTA